jgi:muscarinic acetylcholine receptor M3
LKDPVFNTALIIGYYWTTLIVLFILYGGIYKTAYEMQKKSEAKQRKMQSMVALSAGAMSGMAGRAAGIGITKTPSTILSPDMPKSTITTAVTTTSMITTIECTSTPTVRNDGTSKAEKGLQTPHESHLSSGKILTEPNVSIIGMYFNCKASA